MLYAAAFQFPDGVQVLSAGALRGLKDTRVPMLLAALAYWGIGMPLGAGLGLGLGWGPQGHVDRPDRRPHRRGALLGTRFLRSSQPLYAPSRAACARPSMAVYAGMYRGA